MFVDKASGGKLSVESVAKDFREATLVVIIPVSFCRGRERRRENCLNKLISAGGEEELNFFLIGIL